MGGSERNPDDDLDKARGCVLSWDDEEAVVASVACCLSYIAYGSAGSSLGPALPSMADHFGKSISQLGMAFTIRGVGYFFGTIGSAAVLQYQERLPSKEMLTCLALLGSGILSGIIGSSNSFGVVIACFFIQGLSFGGIDTMGNCVLPELWGRRVQPWMQALHSCFGIGSIIGPALVGALGYRAAFTIMMILSLVPLVLLSSYKLFKFNPCCTVQHIDSSETSLSPSGGSGAGQVVAPLYLRVLVSSFFFTYVGAETGFAGWVPSYALDEGVTSSMSKAAYLSSIFWAALTAGRILAVPSAVLFSATQMIRAQLFLIVLSCFMVMFALNINYSVTCVMCGIVGFSLSSIFPVMMTLFGDYGYAMDATTTSMFMVGATCGESIIPVLIGWAMAWFGAWTMPAVTFLAAVVLLAIYVIVHRICTKSGPLAVANTETPEWGSKSQHTLINPIHGSGPDGAEYEMVAVNFVNEEDTQTV